MNKLKSYYFSFIGISLVGISIGFVVGFFFKNYYLNNDFAYLSVIPMGIGCAFIIYGSLYIKSEQ